MRRPHPADIVIASLALCALAFFILYYLGASARPQGVFADAQTVQGGERSVQEKLDAVLGMASTGSREGKLDLNRVTAAELAGLPGIGEMLGARIVEYRLYNGDFAAVEELEAVTGISAQTAKSLCAWLYVSAPETGGKNDG